MLEGIWMLFTTWLLDWLTDKLSGWMFIIPARKKTTIDCFKFYFFSESFGDRKTGRYFGLVSSLPARHSSHILREYFGRTNRSTGEGDSQFFVGGG